MIEDVLNPNQLSLKKVVKELKSKNETYIDTLIYNHPGIYNHLTSLLSKGDPEVQASFDLDPMLIKKYFNQSTFNALLEQSIENEKFDVDITGTSVVVSEGTQYLVNNLLSSIVFAVVSIAVLMAILFRSWRMVLISLIPNIVPMIITSGIMGWFGIPLKPSTLLVFSIAFGISVDDTIHYLTKYRQELKYFSWDIKTCVIQAIRESGLGMFYTSVVLFCGFSVFTFSQFGGTQALGLLISITLLVAMITNLIVLPSLL
ncbi:MAG: RND family transporter, partial [Crocinitomicaceae bacterium]|nr:RND family transporter [Crocinitomicaceae bacterium]